MAQGTLNLSPAEALKLFEEGIKSTYGAAFDITKVVFVHRGGLEEPDGRYNIGDFHSIEIEFGQETSDD